MKFYKPKKEILLPYLSITIEKQMSFSSLFPDFKKMAVSEHDLASNVQ